MRKPAAVTAFSLFAVAFLLFMSVIVTGCGEQERERTAKDRESAEYGLNRVLTVYDQNGKPIKTYEGRFDIDSNKDVNGATTGSKVKFDLNGKRVIIYNATVIVEEK